MARSAATVWEMRTAGDVDAGGGYVSGGTDHSNQDAVHSARTDLVIGSAGSEDDLTSAADPFASDDVGNIIKIHAGTGFTVGRYEVLSVAAGVATMDRNVGTADSTGGSGKLGGAMTMTDTNIEDVEAGNVCHIANDGTHVPGAFNIATGGTATNYKSFIGYNTSRGDKPQGDNRPLIANGANSILWGTYASIENVRCTTTYSLGFFAGTGFRCVNCKVYNSSGTANSAALSSNLNYARFIKCEAQSDNGAAIEITALSHVLGCYLHDSDDGMTGYAEGATNNNVFVGNIFDTMAVSGLTLAAGLNSVVLNNTFYSCVDGIIATSSTYNTLIGNIFNDNTSYGAEWTTAEYDSNYSNWNDFEGNGTDRGNLMTGTDDISTDPTFGAAATGDFSVGTNMKALGFPGVMPGALCTSYTDVGAVQREEPAGGGGGILINPGTTGGTSA